MTAVSLIELKYIVNLRKNSGYVCDSSVERLPGMLEALGSPPSTSTTKPDLHIRALHRHLDCCCWKSLRGEEKKSNNHKLLVAFLSLLCYTRETKKTERNLVKNCYPRTSCYLSFSHIYSLSNKISYSWKGLRQTPNSFPCLPTIHSNPAVLFAVYGT